MEKYGVSFGEATEVFYDPNALEGYDVEHSANEHRFFIVGLSSSRLLYVVYAERHGDIVRIISSRRAVDREQLLYERPES